MASSATTSTTPGVTTTGLLTIAFVVLKLTHVITWSWVWVLSPLWISVAIALVVGVVIAVVAAVVAALRR